MIPPSRSARVLPVVIVTILAAALVACGSTASRTPDAGSSGTLVVLGPGTLAAALPRLGESYAAASGGTTVTPNLGHSPAQVLALQRGSPGDVFLTAGTAAMTEAEQAGLLAGAPVTFARNALQIVVAAGNPLGVASLADLARADLTVALPDEATPVGRAAAQALRTAGVAVTPASTEQGSPAVVQKVVTGNADAGLVFVTDVRSGGDGVTGVDVPPAQQVGFEYRAAVLAGAADPDGARRFVEFLTGQDARSELDALGFAAP